MLIVTQTPTLLKHDAKLTNGQQNNRVGVVVWFSATDAGVTAAETDGVIKGNGRVAPFFFRTDPT
jgi:hypothetical protein